MADEERAVPADEEDDDLPAWSLPLDAVGGIALEDPLAGPVDREWALGGSTGKDVKVCVLDSGVEPDHPRVGHLAGAVVDPSRRGRRPGREEDTEGDLCGHGTACAGVIHGIAPDAELYSVRVLGSGFTGRATSSSPACGGRSSRATRSST